MQFDDVTLEFGDKRFFHHTASAAHHARGKIRRECLASYLWSCRRMLCPTYSVAHHQRKVRRNRSGSERYHCSQWCELSNDDQVEQLQHVVTLCHHWFPQRVQQSNETHCIPVSGRKQRSLRDYGCGSHDPLKDELDISYFSDTGKALYLTTPLQHNQLPSQF